VVQQITNPKLIMCDTMNFWIEGAHNDLLEILKLVNLLVINDSEARELSKEFNLVTAAKKIMLMGPKILIIKKGEHGALLFMNDLIFSAPAYPLEQVFDPTGAGDTFAGGMMGWLSKTDDLSEKNVKLAVIYGSAMASLAVEKFSLDGIRNLTKEKIKQRFSEFKKLTDFDEISLS
ncbi:MAG: PfkB family carbohydrate kinase, partial [Ignavibacteria bacterium]|nr:PfkB family carbohydrate kinase [Ignavibacteria bacterium]